MILYNYLMLLLLKIDVTLYSNNDIENAHQIRQGELRHSSEWSQRTSLFFQSWFRHDTIKITRIKILNFVYFV